ncbi:phosphatase PAP2 family protein [Streptomyces sp. NBC_00448]|uniref:phosphatase PAP2 family protein n=1 Tax=Streptomyces sp. NBC_00448 TaxID=2903652 RepID=UPI002E20591F
MIPASTVSGASPRHRRGLWPRRTRVAVALCGCAPHRGGSPCGRTGSGPRPGRVRRVGPALALFALFAALFGLLLWALSARDGAPIGPDRVLHHWAVAHRSADLTAVAHLLDSTGAGPLPYIAVMLAGWTGCAHRTASRREVSAALGAVVILLTGQAVRLAVVFALARPRPPVTDWAVLSTDWAFPSGYATTSVLTAGLLAWAVLRSDAPRGAVRFDVLACLLWAAAISATRIYLGVQWPTDELGGWLLGTAWLALTLPILSGLAGPAGRTL